MQKWLRVGVGVGVWGGTLLAACSGKLIDGGAPGKAGAPSAGAPSAGAPSAGASNGGSGNAGGQSGMDAQAGAVGTCQPWASLVSCAASCGSVAPDPTEGVCIDGAWRCPVPLIDPQSCPAEACVLQQASCCDHVYGKISIPECAENGLFAPCAPGLERNAKQCISDSAGTTDCGSLADQSCSLEDAMCDNHGAHCRCIPADGGFIWTCWFDLL